MNDINPFFRCKKLKSGFGGGLQVWKPLICSGRGTHTICLAPYGVHWRGGGDTRWLHVLFFFVCFFFKRVSFRACRSNWSRCECGAYKWDVPLLPFHLSFSLKLGLHRWPILYTYTDRRDTVGRRPHTSFHSQTHNTESSSQGTGCKISWTETSVNSQT